MLTSSEGARILASRILSSHIDHHLGLDHVHYVAPCSGVGSPMFLAVAPCSGVGSPMLLAPSVKIFYSLSFILYPQQCFHIVPIKSRITMVSMVPSYWSHFSSLMDFYVDPSWLKLLVIIIKVNNSSYFYLIFACILRLIFFG